MREEDTSADGAPKLDHRRDGKVTADDGQDALEVLGRGGHDGRLPPQSVANARSLNEKTPHEV